MKENSVKLEDSFLLSPRLGISAVIILHLVITLPLAYFLNIWSDEASTLYTTERGFLQTFQNVFADEKQAPLYFLALSVWREISHSIFFARFFSIVFSVIAIKVFYDLARRFFDEKAAFFITVFFALHPFLIWTSLEIRVYSLVVLLSVLLLKFFADGYLNNENISRKGAKAQRFYILIAVVALYTNYYLGFLLVGNFFALVVCRKWRDARRYFLQMLFVGLAILPLLWTIKTQLAAVSGDVQTPREIAVGVRIIWNEVLNFVLPTELFPPEEMTAISFSRVWFVRLAIFGGGFLLIKTRRIFDEKILAFGVICVTICVFLLFAYFLLGDIYVEVRHAALLFPPLILFVGVVLKEIFPQKRKDAKNYLPIAAAILLTGLFAYSISTLYPNLAKRGDWARVCEFIQQNEKPNQPIIVFTVFDALDLPYYYQGANRILPAEKFFNWGIEGEYGAADSLKKENEYVISQIPPAAPEIWLATGERCQMTKACAPLENFVAANYTVIEEKDFYKEKVRLLRKK